MKIFLLPSCSTAGLRIVEDARIVRGGCLIETAQGDLDATLQTRWRQVIAVLGPNKNWLE